MNLEDSDKFMQENEDRNRKKRFLLILIIICAILIAFLFVIILYVKYKDEHTLKMYVDGTQVSISSDLFVSVNDTTYVNIRQIAKTMGLTYTRGSYGEYTEDNDTCYLTGNHEVINFELGSTTFTKYILNSDDISDDVATEEEKIYGAALTVKSENNAKEVFTMDEEIEQIDGNLYMPFSILPDVFNIQINTSEANRIRIYTMQSLYKNAARLAAKLSYTTITGTYENLRALADGFIVVGNSNGKFGVIDTTGTEVISIKYDEVEFIQNVKEFFVYADKNVGLLSSDGTTIIKPTEYDTISVFDADKQLYEVTKNGKYGILNRAGEVIIHAEYDQIGLQNNSSYSTSSDDVYDTLDNKMILFDKCIPVKQNAKYGLFDIEGNEVAKTVYDSIGYFVEDKDTSSSSSSSSSSSNSTTIVGETSVITIPETVGIKGIVLNQNGLYGIYDAEAERLIIPIVCTKIYSITKAGVTTYYMEFNGTQFEVSSYLKQEGLVSVTSDTENTTSYSDSSNSTASRYNSEQENESNYVESNINENNYVETTYENNLQENNSEETYVQEDYEEQDNEYVVQY
jgi:hypothetical protein